MFIDSHAHLFFEDFQSDLPQVLEKIVKAQVDTVINIGVDIKTSKKALKQAQDINSIKVYSTIGLHPHDSADSLVFNDNVSMQNIMDELEELYKTSPEKIVGVGECGLDYYSPRNDVIANEVKQSQIQLFKAQIELAKKLNLPLVIHCRDAWDEIFEYLDDSISGVFHCWSGSYQDAQKALGLGFFISFAGNITYPKAQNLRQVASLLPLDRILIETDSPFLSPQDKRGQRNDPTSVVQIAQTIAEIKNLKLTEIANKTSQNAKILFKI